MPVPRCDTCGQVLNADSSCVNVVECKEPDLHKTIKQIAEDYYCFNCRHFFETKEEHVPKQKKSNKKTDNNKAP